ncbi:hypothetical protein K503DRAFT_806674 [Rhizopogon vinicolor AM-OR11-026]|uniref:Uncharacterized protein n=1 Tax=Rhizopogon vinicolor AM-OR11-026 TaxID=1314800 RepID=A0A1B7ME09_9AGAM|nr:hypothetical protein K503DRAFT_806674 [Rhizopogon vinicolor AM-OR11-026]
MTAIIGSNSFYNSPRFLSITETRRHSAPEATTITNNRTAISPVLLYQEGAKKSTLSRHKVPSAQADLKNDIRATTDGLASLIVKSMTPMIPIATCAIPTASVESAITTSKSCIRHPLIINYIIQHADLGYSSSDSYRDLLQKLVWADSDTHCMDFKDVGKVAFNLVLCIVEETEVFSIRKPRLTYISPDHSSASKGVLIVEWPSAMHEVPFQEMDRAFTMAFHDLLYEQDTILATDEEELFQKLISEVAKHPEVVLVVVVIIKEESPYRSPAPHSPPWETLCKDAEYLSFDHFVAKIEGSQDRVLSRPAVVAGHTWCKIASIEYKVWVKADGDEPIDLVNHDAVTGVHFQNIFHYIALTKFY